MMRGSFVWSGNSVKYFRLAVIFLLAAASACQVKQKPYRQVYKDQKSPDEMLVSPDVYVGIVLIPYRTGSLFKLKEIIEKHPGTRITLAIPHDFIVPSEKNSELMEYFKTLESDGRLSFFHSLSSEPILPLIADNSDHMKRSYLNPGKKPKVFNWPEDVRDQIALEREAFLNNWGIEPAGFMPFGGIIDESSIKPLIHSKAKITISGVPINEYWNVGRVKDLTVFCCSKDISNILYSEDYIAGPDGLADDIMRCLEPANDLHIAVLDEKVFKKRKKLDFYKFFEELITGIENSDVEFTLLEKYLEENEESIPPIRAKEVVMGSWLSEDLSPWIGEMEEDVAWEMLAVCREAVEDYKDSGRADLRRLDSAMQEIYTAEAGRNFYFFGNDFDSPKEQEIDQFFRAGLSNIYRLIRESPPEELYRPINLFKPSDRHGTGAKTAIKKGENYIFWEDFEGDDSGASSLSYPELNIIPETAGLADILSFGFRWDKEFINVEFTLKRLDNFWNAPAGFSFPLIDLYIDLNNRHGAGSTNALQGRKVSFSEQDAWEYVIVVNGWGARLYRSAPDGNIFKVTSLKCQKGKDGKTINVKVPRKVLRGNPFNWGYAVLVMGHARLIMKDPPEPMGIAGEPSENNFTSSAGTDVPPVVDIIVPEGRQQKDILNISSYSGSAVVPVLRVE